MPALTGMKWGGDMSEKFPEGVMIINIHDNEGKLFEKYFTTEHPYEIEKVLNKELCVYFTEDELKEALDDKEKVLNKLPKVSARLYDGDLRWDTTPAPKVENIPEKNINPKNIKISSPKLKIPSISVPKLNSPKLKVPKL